MGKRSSPIEIERWRRDYWLLRKALSNNDIAVKLGVDPGYLSKIARGAKDKNGHPKNPGAAFIKQFYMEYNKLLRSPENNEKDFNSKAENPGYDHEHKKSASAEEAQLRYMNRADELLDHYKTNAELLKGGFTEMLHIARTMAEAQDKSVKNQGEMIQVHGQMVRSHDKTVDSHCDMTKSILILAEITKQEYLESRGKNTEFPKPPPQSPPTNP